MMRPISGATLSASLSPRIVVVKTDRNYSNTVTCYTVPIIDMLTCSGRHRHATEALGLVSSPAGSDESSVATAHHDMANTKSPTYTSTRVEDHLSPACRSIAIVVVKESEKSPIMTAPAPITAWSQAAVKTHGESGAVWNGSLYQPSSHTTTAMTNIRKGCFQ